jgi:spore coat polysaccharide biosynthesis protein SpsF
MVEPSVIAIVQARVGSTRLPNKVLSDIVGKPLLWHIIKRLVSIKKIDEVAIATSTLSENDVLYDFAQENNIYCHRGSENDVISRFYEAARIKGAKHIIRITADCPLVDPFIISDLIDYYFDNSYDFCGIACGAGVYNEKNILRYPDGLDAEIFSFAVLENAFKNATELSHREHVTPYIWKNKNLFNIGTLFPVKNDYSSYRFTIDNEEDLDTIKSIYNQLYSRNKIFTFIDAIKLIKQNKIKVNNKHLIGKEGYNEFWE